MGYFSDTTPRIIMKLFLVVALFASAYKFKMPDLHRKLQEDFGDCSKVEAAYIDAAGFDYSSMDDVKDLDAGKQRDGCVEATDEEDCEEFKAICQMHLFVSMEANCPENWKAVKEAVKEADADAKPTKEACDEFNTGDCNAAIDDGYALTSDARDEYCEDCEKENEGFYCNPAMLNAPSFLVALSLAMASVFFSKRADHSARELSHAFG